MKPLKQLVATGALFIAIGALAIWWHFDSDIKAASAKAALGGVLIETRCGPIEYQEAGTGTPLLMVHGSGGGHDQGMAFASKLTQRGIRVIAVSRFGYLRTPMPLDASPAAQADAHVCLLDALGIAKAAVLGGSAGGPSALQMAIRHPDRVSALVLLVPLAYKPSTSANSAKPLAPWAESLLMRLIGSDFLFWAWLHVARDRGIKYVLATLPDQVSAASSQERAGIVIAALDGLPDLQVPQMDRDHMAGNHVLLRCKNADVLLGHFKTGSVKVVIGQQLTVGQPMANVGNSGNTGEPHLHIHAQQAGAAAEPFSGTPLPVRFGERFLVRNDRVSAP
jgi:pimeloyl-ACP methyl ester carboxylesterase